MENIKANNDNDVRSNRMDNPSQHSAQTRFADWHAESISSVCQRLTTARDGLSMDEARSRLEHYGPNALPTAKLPGLPQIFLRQFRNPLVYLLLAATVVSFVVGEVLDGLFIFVVLLFNAIIGAVQEWRAQIKATELNRLVPHRTIVHRGGHWIELETGLLVPGDVVRLETGARIGADLRLLDSRELRVDESLITGESLPVDKQTKTPVARTAPVADRTNMLFASTIVMSGRATAMVVGTGQDTEIGQIAIALQQADTSQPPLTRQLERFSRAVGIATIILIGMVATAQIFQGLPLLTVFLVSVALAVAAIPEGLPVAITVTLAIATNRMQRRNVVVRFLSAVEGLGSCTLIASDKTGTLTLNELTATSLVLFDKKGSGVEVEITAGGLHTNERKPLMGPPSSRGIENNLSLLAETAILCNEASQGTGDKGSEWIGDTVDIAFLVMAQKIGLDPTALRKKTTSVATIAYEPEHRYAAAFTRSPDEPEGRLLVHVKGAAEVVVPACIGVDRDAVFEAVEKLADGGHRVIAVACGTTDPSLTEHRAEEAIANLTLVGLVGLIDPIRPEVPQAIENCRQAGIDVVMITGDHPTTALAIARRLNLADSAADVAGEEDVSDAMANTQKFDALLRDRRVFARIEPLKKLDIVRGLQSLGHVVAVTGDGVNDAPALKAADIGVAMGKSGTDVARSAADLIIADDNFASIFAGVEEGRAAYDNVRKLIYLLISTGLGEIVLFMLAILFGLPVPLFAVQLLWLNLVTNGIQDIALAFEKGEPGITRRMPRPKSERLFDQRMTAQVMIAGFYMGAASCAAYAWFLHNGYSLEEARNLVLMLMVLFENAHALNARSERQSIFRISLMANPFLLIAVIGAQLLHIGAMFTPGLSQVLDIQPISPVDWLIVGILAISLIFVMEIFKVLYNRFMSQGHII